MRRITGIFHTAAVQMAVIVGLAMVALLTCGCRRMPDERLLRAQSIMEEHPDSALRLLEGISLPEGAPEHDRALHALLLTHARYKNYIDETGDSLIRIAAEYFGKHGPAEEASKALFLLGKTQMNAKRYGEAAVSLSRGLDLAKANGIHLWEGHCARGLSMLYGEVLNSSAQLAYSIQALEAFTAAGDDDWADWSRLDIGYAYNNNRQHALALDYAKALKNTAEMKRDTLLLKEALYLLSTIQYATGQYVECIDSYALAFKLDPEIKTENDKVNLLEALSKLDVNNLRNESLDLVEFLAGQADGDSSFSLSAEQGNYEEAYRLLTIYKNEQDSVLTKVLGNNVSGTVTYYQEALQKAEETRRFKERVTWVLVLTGMFFVIGFLIIILKNRYKKTEAAKQKMMDEMESLRKDFADILEKHKLLSESFVKSIREKYEKTDSICNEYYENQYSSEKRAKYSSDISKIVSEFNDADNLLAIERDVDKFSEGVYSNFKNDYPEIKPDELSLYLYLMLGFCPRTIAVIINQETSVVYNRKSRLKTKIQRSDVVRKDDYLKYF